MAKPTLEEMESRAERHLDGITVNRDAMARDVLTLVRIVRGLQERLTTLEQERLATIEERKQADRGTTINDIDDLRNMFDPEEIERARRYAASK